MDVRIALIAHDRRKDDLIALARAHRQALRHCHVCATATTGQRLDEALGLPVERLLSGPRGGDLQVASRVMDGRLDMVVLLRDPLSVHPHEVDVMALVRTCDVYDVPCATNRATAALLMDEMARRVTRTRHPPRVPRCSP